MPVGTTVVFVVLVELVAVVLAGLVVLEVAWRSLVAAGKIGFSIWKKTSALVFAAKLAAGEARDKLKVT